MKIVNTGHVYSIYDDSLKTFDRLPAQAYQINFNPRAGFSLSLYDEIEIKEKVYGIHMQKVEKVLKSFEMFDRNLGVILSGDKGIGKSLFAKILSKKAIELGYPLIIVNNYYPGIADYLNSIQQEVVVLFDEFDKNFYAGRDKSDSMNDPQTEMLTLFDGLSQGKKMFIITCNYLNNLNDFLVNRPGRFHYHFRFEYPNAEEIEMYLKDKIPTSMYNEIQKVVDFSQKVKINYDSLRAIAFELSLEQENFETIIKDLNILNIEDETYTAIVVFNGGTKKKVNSGRSFNLDMFNSNIVTQDFEDEEVNQDIYFEFNPIDITYKMDFNGMVLKGEDVNINLNSNNYDDDMFEKVKMKYQENPINYIIFHRKFNRNLHYTL